MTVFGMTRAKSPLFYTAQQQYALASLVEARLHRRTGWPVALFGVAVIVAAVLSLPHDTWAPAVGYQPIATAAPASAPQPSAGGATLTATSTTSHRSDAAATPDCTPLSFGTPSQLNLADLPTGLTRVVEPNATYRVYGHAVDAIARQIARCAPGDGVAAYAGNTSYQLNWQYAYRNIGGACRINDVRVGLHVQTALPRWQASRGDASGLAGSWQQFAANLQMHESGHVALDKQYAAKLLADLQKLPPTSCAALGAAVDRTAATDSAALQRANAAYDAATQHGRNQGAVL